MEGKIRPFDVLKSPFIKVTSEVIMPGLTNGKPNIQKVSKYVVAPSAKKISTFIINQIFGSELVTQTEGLNINWLMPTLKKTLETAIYQEEAFIYIHKFDKRVFLQCIRKNELHDLVQEYDRIVSCKIIQDFNDDDEYDYALERDITIKDGTTELLFKAYQKSKRGTEYIPMSLKLFNYKTGHDYKDIYILPYEVLVNIDLGTKFFEDSEKLLNGEMKVINTLADEIEKTKTRIVTTQHYQTNDIVMNWRPASTHYDIQTINVNELQDYFTLLPGDKEHQMFQFLQGNIRVESYVEAFKFYDYQCIQSAGLSPASFGYEKDEYMNVDNINLSKNASDMTVEAIKTQIEPQLDKLFTNIVKLQKSQKMTENIIPANLNWNYGENEKLTDMKKLQVLGKVENVSAVPYAVKAKIIMPILKKLINKDYDKEAEELIKQYSKEREADEIKFGEI